LLIVPTSPESLAPLPTIGPPKNTAQNRRVKHRAVMVFSSKKPSLFRTDTTRPTSEAVPGSGMFCGMLESEGLHNDNEKRRPGGRPLSC
jgi:hypothetical protein